MGRRAPLRIIYEILDALDEDDEMRKSHVVNHVNVNGKLFDKYTAILVRLGYMLIRYDKPWRVTCSITSRGIAYKPLIKDMLDILEL